MHLQIFKIDKNDGEKEYFARERKLMKSNDGESTQPAFLYHKHNFSEQDKTFLEYVGSIEESNRILMPVEEDELSLHYSSNYRVIKLTPHEEIAIVYEDHQIIGLSPRNPFQ